MKVCTFILIMFSCLVSHAQHNLVPNHSFEDYFRCPNPNNSGNIKDIRSFVYEWSDIVKYGTTITSGILFPTSQYFNRCLYQNRGSTIPNNNVGYQYSIDGDAYAGIYTRFNSLLNNPEAPGRNLYLVKLKQGLIPGKLYSISYMASPCDSLGYYMSHMGANLYTYAPSYMGRETLLNLPNKAHIVDTTILDCEKCWYKISGEVVADSSYAYLVIGNFYSWNRIKYKPIPNGRRDINSPTDILGGYYIDYVEVYEVQQLFAGSNKICKGDSVALWTYKVPSGSKWKSASTTIAATDTQWVKPLETTTYVLYTLGDEAFDSLTIEVFEPPTVKILPADTLLCKQPFITLNATFPGSEYNWSTNDTVSTINVSNKGWYYVQMGLPKCRFNDSIYVDVCNPTLFVPNAFTPNGDGLNDEFKPSGVRVHEYNLQIYNRWGKKIFESNNIDEGWRGEDASSDVFVYVINYQDDYGWHNLKGTFTVVK